jgi:hypothetical protein
VTLRKSVVPAALALAGCLPTGSEPPGELEQLTYSTPVLGGSCDVEQANYEIYAEVLRPGGQLKSSSSTGALVFTVSESSSVVDCNEDIVRIAMPGAELTREAVAAHQESLKLDVPATVIGGHRPSIRVAALLDVNDNGECDLGELTASVEAEPSELGKVLLALADEGCPERL